MLQRCDLQLQVIFTPREARFMRIGEIEAVINGF